MKVISGKQLAHLTRNCQIKLEFGNFKFVIVNFGRQLALFGQELANISSNYKAGNFDKEDKTGNFIPQQCR